MAEEGLTLIGIITFAYGAPASLDDIEAYYTHINNNKTQPAEKIEEMKDRYRHIAIGDTLGSITKRQIKALATSLQPYIDEPIKGYTAYKHTEPFVEDTVRQMIADGVSQIITFPMKVLYSKSSITHYNVQVKSALKKLNVDIPVQNIEPWHHHPSIVRVLSDRVRTAWNWLPHDVKPNASVIFTSHSIPGRPKVQEAFENQFITLGQRIAEDAAISEWRISYRSASSNDDIWLGPDIKDVINEEAQKGRIGIIVCELLSLTSNVEAAFDIGYDIQPICREKGIEFFQTAMVDDSFDFIMALRQITLEQLADNNFPIRQHS